jgi:hypothetical protein
VSGKISTVHGLSRPSVRTDGARAFMLLTVGFHLLVYEIKPCHFCYPKHSPKNPVDAWPTSSTWVGCTVLLYGVAIPSLDHRCMEFHATAHAPHNLDGHLISTAPKSGRSVTKVLNSVIALSAQLNDSVNRQDIVLATWTANAKLGLMVLFY